MKIKLDNKKWIQLDEQRTYGVELEISFPRRTGMINVSMTDVAAMITEAGVECHDEHYNHETKVWWKIVPDGSLHGDCTMEVVSPPLQGKNGIDELKIVCEVLNKLGAEINQSCGVHVHHHAADFDMTTWRNIIKLYAKFETLIDTFVPQSRRGDHNSYCRSITETLSRAHNRGRGFATYSEPTLKQMFNQIDRKALSIDGLVNLLGSRFHKINVESFLRHETVEFRQYAGSTNFEKIANWISFTQGLVTQAKVRKTVSTKSGENFDSLMSAAFVLKSTKEFFKNRQESFGTRIAS